MPNPHWRYAGGERAYPFRCHWFVDNVPIPATFTEGMKYLDRVRVTLDEKNVVVSVEK